MQPAIPSARLLDAQNAQIWTASLMIGIEPKSAQNGGSPRAVNGEDSIQSVIGLKR